MHRLQFSWPIPIFWKCDLPIQIFTDSDFLSMNYHWQHIQTKYNNSQNKVLCDWKEEEIVNLKWVAVWNKTDVISHYVYKWSFFPLTLLNVLSFTSNSYFVSINSVNIIRNCRVVTIQMKLVLRNLILYKLSFHCWGNRSSTWSGIRCIYTDSLMKLRCHKCIYTAKFQMHK